MFSVIPIGKNDREIVVIGVWLVVGVDDGWCSHSINVLTIVMSVSVEEKGAYREKSVCVTSILNAHSRPKCSPLSFPISRTARRVERFVGETLVSRNWALGNLSSSVCNKVMKREDTRRMVVNKCATPRIHELSMQRTIVSSLVEEHSMRM